MEDATCVRPLEVGKCVEYSGILVVKSDQNTDVNETTRNKMSEGQILEGDVRHGLSGSCIPGSMQQKFLLAKSGIFLYSLLGS